MSRIEPGLPGATVRPSNEVFVDPRDGSKYLGVHITISPEIFEQYRTGYRCLACHTPQDEPFPEVCKEVYKDGGGCGYRMKDDQMRRLQYEFRGEVDLWEGRDEDFERQNWARANNVWLPNGE